MSSGAANDFYDVLGVRPDATAATIRESYRALARAHHPDRVASSPAAAEQRMAAINEAYHVLSDPARRAVYDARRRGGGRGASGVRPSATRPPAADGPVVDDAPFEPARIPWRMLTVCSVLAILGVFVLAQFTEPGDPATPDGILRAGDCVEIERETFAREVPCTGAGDLVVRRFVPFDEECGALRYLQDVQGMGAVCVEQQPAASGT